MILTPDTIPSSVAAEAVLSIWRKKPHVAKFHQNELFGKFYEDVFTDLNAAQLVIAVLIYRYCDSQRKRESLINQYPHISYSQHFMSMLIGKQLLKKLNVSLSGLTHRNFQDAKIILDENLDTLYEQANVRLVHALDLLYNGNYKEVERRRLSSTFRRGDLLNVLITETDV